jgi:hypothetical protein
MEQVLLLEINASPEYCKLTVMEQELMLGINSSPENLKFMSRYCCWESIPHLNTLSRQSWSRYSIAAVD